MSSCQASACKTPSQAAGDLDRKWETGDADSVQGFVRDYYGQQLQTSDDCQTGVNCLVDSSMPPHVTQALAQVHDEVTMRYFGCGAVIPEAVEGCSILDLGSGSGRDCFALSRLVGEAGRVVGVDMTEEQLALARKYIGYHSEKFGYAQPNVEFLFGYIEKLAEAGLKSNTFDIIISNCVVNLSTDKRTVLSEAYRVLKEGGEVYFSDIYTDTHLSESVRNHQVLWGECISGALQWDDFYSLTKQVGFSQPRLVSAKLVDVGKFTHILGDAKFVSVTYRLFKLPSTKRGEATVTYTGGIVGSPDKLAFDRLTTFETGSSRAVDSELATILSSSRFGRFFSFGDADAAGCYPADPKINPFTIVKHNCCAAQTNCC